MNYFFGLPTKVVFGSGTLNNNLKKEVSCFDAKKILIITDAGIAKTNILSRILKCFKEIRIDCKIFENVESDPSTATAIKAAEVGKDFQAEILIALGGGSVIDTAKCAAFLIKESFNLKDFINVDKVKKLGIPVIAIPTTAGTGSEVTIFAVMSDPESNGKFTISSPLIAPRVAILDPTLTLTLPPHITAYTGIDALTHAIEAYTSVIAQPITDALALRAIDLIMRNLRVAVGRGDNLQARENMLQAALLAGVAFNNAFLGLCHAIASPLGSYFHIPHGLANAIMLSHVMEYNLLTATDKFATISKVLGLAYRETNEMLLANRLIESVRILIKDINIPAKLRNVGVKENKLKLVAKDALKSIQLKFNARIVNEQDIIELLKKTF